MPERGTAEGRVRLSDAVIGNLQNNFGAATRNKKKSVHKLKMLCGLFINIAFYVRMSQCHNNITSFQKIALHGFRYQRDQAEKTTTYSQYKCLPPVFRNELKPLFTRLSDTKLLQRCLKRTKQSILLYGAKAQNVCSVLKLN